MSLEMGPDMTSKNNIEAIRQTYDVVAPLARRFCQKLAEQVQELLATAGVSLAVPIECRVKDWESIRDKIDSRELNIRSAQEVSDLVGIRLILLFKRDVQKTCDTIVGSFDVLSIEDTADRLGDSEFGYQSIHYQIRLPKAWLAVPSFAAFAGLQAEVQIRSAAQHIWAAASHVLQYKHEESVPLPVRRAIHRVSALLETVDLEFERALQERDSYSQAIDLSISSATLNVDILARMLDDSLPPQNKEKQEPYANLLQELYAQGITKVADVQKLLDDHLADVLREDTEIVSILQNGNVEGDAVEATIRGIIHTTKKSRLEQGVFYTHAGLLRAMLER